MFLREERVPLLISLLVSLMIISSTFFPFGLSDPSLEELEIEFIDPEEGDTWTGSSEQDITWKINTTLELSEIEVSLEYVYNGSGPHLIKRYDQGELTEQKTNYTWDVPEIDSDDVYLIIRAEGGGIKRWEMISISIDSTPPQFLFVQPEEGGFILTDDPIEVTFDQMINTTHFDENFTLYGPDGEIDGDISEVSNDNFTVVFQPAIELEPGEDYYFELSGNITDTSQPGNILEIDKEVNFSVKKGAPEVFVSSDIDEEIRIGNNTEIEWDIDQEELLPGSISISYSLDGGETWINISEGLEDEETYTWEVPKEPFVEYPVRGVVLNVSCKNIHGFTGYGHSSSFIIYENKEPVVEVERPYEGLVLVEGQRTEIKWDAVDDVPLPERPITISVSTDGGDSWTVISHDVRNTGVFDWEVDIVSESTIINVSCTDADGATSWSHSGEFTIMEENPLQMSIEPVLDIYHPRDRITIEWDSTPMVEDLQGINVYFSDDGESWNLQDEVEADKSFTEISLPFAMSSKCRIMVEVIDETGPLYSVKSEDFEVIPLIEKVELTRLGGTMMIHLSFNSWVSRGRMEETLTLYQGEDIVDLERNNIYAMSGSDIVIMLEELDKGDYSLRFNSTGSSLDFTDHEIYTFEITDPGTEDYVTYWPVLLLVPITVFILFIYKRKLEYSDKRSKRKFT